MLVYQRVIVVLRCKQQLNLGLSKHGLNQKSTDKNHDLYILHRMAILRGYSNSDTHFGAVFSNYQ